MFVSSYSRSKVKRMKILGFVSALALFVMSSASNAQERTISAFAQAQIDNQEKQAEIAKDIASAQRTADARLVEAKENAEKYNRLLNQAGVLDLDVKVAYFDWPVTKGDKSIKDFELKYTSPSLMNAKAILDFKASMVSDGYFIKKSLLNALSNDHSGRNEVVSIRFYKM